MSSISPVSHALQSVLTETASTAARTTGFLRRERQLTGASFVQALVFGFLAHPTASVEHLAQRAGNSGTPISAQGLDQRVTPAAAAGLHAVLAAAVQHLLAAPAAPVPLLARCSNVFIRDSTTMTLPDALAGLWSGCGGTTPGTAAALKLHVLWHVTTGALTHLDRADGRACAQRAPVQQVPVPPGSRRLADLGYCTLDHLAAAQAAGTHVVSRWFPTTARYALDGTPLDRLTLLRSTPAAPVARPLSLGARHRGSVRLLAVPVPQEGADQRRRRLRATARRNGRRVRAATLALASWTICSTTVPADQLSLVEARVLLRVRWQIELRFKLWTSQGRLDESRRQNPWRVLSERYAKLLSMLVLHWITIVGCWPYPNRSRLKAAQLVHGDALALGTALAHGARPLQQCRKHLMHCFAHGCRINTRKRHPNTYQLLLGLT